MNFIRWGLLLGLSLSALSQASETPQDYRHGAALQLAGEGPGIAWSCPSLLTSPPGMVICAICAYSTAMVRCRPMR